MATTMVMVYEFGWKNRWKPVEVGFSNEWMSAWLSKMDNGNIDTFCKN